MSGDIAGIGAGCGAAYAAQGINAMATSASGLKHERMCSSPSSYAGSAKGSDGPLLVARRLAGGNAFEQHDLSRRDDAWLRRVDARHLAYTMLGAGDGQVRQRVVFENSAQFGKGRAHGPGAALERLVPCRARVCDHVRAALLSKAAERVEDDLELRTRACGLL